LDDEASAVPAGIAAPSSPAAIITVTVRLRIRSSMQVKMVQIR
jgi:hypothetical protein